MQSVFPKNRDKPTIFKASTLTPASLATVFFTPGSTPEAMPKTTQVPHKTWGCYDAYATSCLIFCPSNS